MSIEIYNTKTGQKSPLITLEEGKVKLYVCGITAYDYFRATGFNGYGSLSGRNLDEMQAGARVSINEQKENPMSGLL